MLKIYNYKTKEVMTLDINDYLIGVVAFEVPATFELEALKAQAVVARSYGLTKIIDWSKDKTGHLEAPLCTDPSHCQGWYSDEELKKKWGSNYAGYLAKITKAVRDTGLEVAYYQNAVVNAVYHSTCGGKTEDAINAWGSAVPYLKSVACEYCKHSPRYRDNKEISLQELAEKLKVNLEGFIKIKPNSTGRVGSLSLNGKNISGKATRSLLSLNSTWFNPKLSFETKGYGHGVGMCQYGADGQAKAGRKYREIVEYYYRGTEVMEAMAEAKQYFNLEGKPTEVPVPTVTPVPPNTPAVNVIKVLDIRFAVFDDPKDNKQKSRMVIDLSTPVNYFTLNTLTEPNRIYVDIPNSQLEGGTKEVKIEDNLVKVVRVGQFNENTVRVVVEVSKEAPFKVFTLGVDNSVNPPKSNRLVIDVIRDGVISPDPTPAPTPVPKTLAGKHIVLDPGHGGKDPGAIGYLGLEEKDVVLDVAVRLNKLLTAAGAVVTMTRNSDVYLSLASRTAIANQTKAQAYVSIHCNSYANPSAHGLETFHYYNSNGGKSLAAKLQQQLVAGLGWRDRGVKTAGFHVLRYTKMYATLVEIGFISNPTEGKALAESTTRQKAAEAIYKGIVGYFG